MSRNPQIEAIHESRYDLETCSQKEKPAARSKLYALLHEAGSKRIPPVRPDDLLDALYEDYQEFRRMKRRQAWPKLQQ
jgi:hypothetical protein